MRTDAADDFRMQMKINDLSKICSKTAEIDKDMFG